MPCFHRQISAVLIGTLLMLSGCSAYRLSWQGEGEIEKGQYAAGLDHLRQAAAASEQPSYKQNWLRKRDEIIASLLATAEQQQRQGQFDLAEESYRKIAQISPDHPRLNNDLERLATAKAQAARLENIKTLMKQGNTAHASGLLEVALQESPMQPALLTLRRELQSGAVGGIAVPNLNQLSKTPVSLEFRDANVRMVFDILARSSGINFILDRDIKPDLATTIFVRQVSLEDAVDLILSGSKLRKKILNGNTVLIYPDTPDKQAEHQEQVVKSFYLTSVDAKRISDMLKTLLKVKNLYIDERLNIVSLRDTPETIQLAEKLIAMQDLRDPEVMLEVEVLEVNRSRLTELGIAFPNQLTLTPLQTANGANLLLSDLRHLNQANTVIGGLQAKVNLTDQDGDINLLANPRIRARNLERANILIGDKIPIITTTTTSTGFSSESVQYQDVGLKLDVQPTVYLDNDVGIKVSLEVSSLGPVVQSKAGTVAYQISTRNANTALRLKDGETQILAGLISREERSSANKLPGLGDLPLIGRLFSSHLDNNKKTEIILSITPRIIRSLQALQTQDATVWAGTENYLRLKPAYAVANKANPPNSGPAEMPLTAGQWQAANTPTPNPTLGATLANASEPAGAESSSSFKLTTTQQTLKVGEATQVTLQLKSAGGIHRLPLQLGFDPKLLDITAVTEGGFFKQGGANSVFGSTVSNADGKVYISAASANPQGAQGQDGVLTLALKAKAAGHAELKVLSANPIGSDSTQPFKLSLGEPLRLTIQ